MIILTYFNAYIYNPVKPYKKKAIYIFSKLVYIFVLC